MKKMTVGLVANAADPSSNNEINTVYSSQCVLDAITASLESTGSRVIPIDADKNFYERISTLKEELDIVFNLAEGPPMTREDAIPGIIISDEIGAHRKSFIVRIMDELNIPYTGPNARTIDLGDGKSSSRELLPDSVPQPKWQLITSIHDSIDHAMSYPLFVKPNAEGASIGVYQDSVVKNEEELFRVADRLFAFDVSSVIVEEYLEGIEYNTGILGDLILPGLDWDHNRLPGKEAVRDHKVKEMSKEFYHLIPDGELKKKIAKYAVLAHHSIGNPDFSRSDFREDGRRQPNFLEINVFPGLHPYNSCFTYSAKLAGIEYNDFINTMIHLAIKRISTYPDHLETFNGKDHDGFEDAYRKIVHNTNWEEYVVNENRYMLIKPSF
jgi:D-alanine-D-alanine ligase